ncbi:hypothetical protein B0T16DRAFT_397152 [Cercophora newfieldiana]|uniref:Uncharacterized protein n=1 Tax=Cercophora newfieldiana TaxID=92897 RepID=A0AA39YN06_9PEZI|nr:hypothetical protein B0T16DRAFT_397152 [Cercophora newfieldiana]
MVSTAVSCSPATPQRAAPLRATRCGSAACAGEVQPSKSGSALIWLATDTLVGYRHSGWLPTLWLATDTLVTQCDTVN